MAKPELLGKGDCKQIYDDIFQEADTGFLDVIFGENSKLTQEDFISLLSCDQMKYLQVHECRKMVYERLQKQ